YSSRLGPSEIILAIVFISSSPSPFRTAPLAASTSRRSSRSSALSWRIVFVLNHESSTAGNAGPRPLRTRLGTPCSRALLRARLAFRLDRVVERHAHRIRPPALHPAASHVLRSDVRPCGYECRRCGYQG